MMNGAQITAVDLQNVSNSWHIDGTGDFNGDGKSDILWRNDNGQVSIWMMNGAQITAVDLQNVSNSWHIDGTGDFNGDGKSDILWRNDNGQVSIWMMNGGSIIPGHDPPVSTSIQNTTASAAIDNSASQNGTSIFTSPATSSSMTTVQAASATQTLTGTGSNDTFVFNSGAIGHDTITNFQPTSDVIQIDHSVFANVQALLAATQDDGHGNVVITADAHDSITLQHVALAQLQTHQSDFHII
jgi:hypothetical protein